MTSRSCARPSIRRVLGTVFVLVFEAVAARAQVPAPVRDGANPRGALIQARDGNFYGTTASGGQFDRGTVFELKPDGTLTILHSFVRTTDGASPLAALIEASDGSLYGTAAIGGPFGCGTVFRIDPDWTFTVVHAFAGGVADGCAPEAPVLLASDGNLYGTTSGGGAFGSGTVFRLTSNGVETVTHSFDFVGGASPRAALIQGTDQQLYGTTSSGGLFIGETRSFSGVIFRMTLDGSFAVLNTVLGDSPPAGPLLQGTDGNFYGTTTNAFHVFAFVDVGAAVFRMTPAGAVTEMYRFKSPASGLMQARDGNLYGATSQSSFLDLATRRIVPVSGTAFRITLTGVVSILHVFGDSPNGTDPQTGLIQGADGSLHGTTSRGGTYNAGTVFQLAFDGSFAVGHAFRPGLWPRVGMDIDGDGRGEITVFRPTTGTWFTRYSTYGYVSDVYSAYQWGLPGDVPMSGDFDGDGRTDLTVFRPANGNWYIRYSSQGYRVEAAATFQWGLPGDIPIAGDFDGDGQTELAVYRPTEGNWYIRFSSLGYSVASSSVYQWGLPGDIPLAGDFDGDGRTDLAIFRPSDGTWWIRYSSRDYDPLRADVFQWGLPGDIPVSGDFDGDGRTDLVVYRPSIGGWFIQSSQLGYSPSTYSYYQWGLPGDLPLSIDLDGDGQNELAVFRPATGEWWVRYSTYSYEIPYYGWYQWGLPGDVPIG